MKKNKFFGQVATQETVEDTTAELNEVESTESLGEVETETDAVVEVESRIPPESLPHAALGSFYDTNTNTYYLARIGYNPATGEVGKLEILEERANDRMTINEAFKINVVRNGILG